MCSVLLCGSLQLDLVPTVATLLRLEKWVRMRAKAGGLVQPDGVHIRFVTLQVPV